MGVRRARTAGGGPAGWQVGAAGESRPAAAKAAAAAASGWAVCISFPPPPPRSPPACPVRGARGCAPRPLPAATGRSLLRLSMSLPVVLPGSCCPVAGLAGGPQAGGPGAAATASQEAPLPPLRPRWPRAALQPPGRPRCAANAAGVLAAPPALSSRRAAAAAAAAPGSALLPARPLLSLGLLQLILGCCMVALSFGALSLSSSPQVKNSCPFWAGSSVSAARVPLALAGPARGAGGSGRSPPLSRNCLPQGCTWEVQPLRAVEVFGGLTAGKKGVKG